MQSQIQMNSRPNPVDTVTTEQLLDSETSTLSEPNAQKEENKSSAPAESETVTPPHENETRMHTAGTQDMENEHVVQSVTEPTEMEKDAVTKPNAPSELLSDGNRSKRCEPKTKKQDKGVRDGKKYIPSKKAMIDPLKIDMSKALVMPLTTSQLSLQCIECHIIFSDPKSKERHLKLSHPAEYEQSILRNALFACYVCDRHFTNSTELMAHQKAHTEKKPFKCPICSQAFSKSSELTFHKKIHFGRDGYTCTDCGKPCKTLTLLKYHQRTHTGERPYVCKECGKRFSMSKALQRHVASHSSEGDDQDGGDTATAEAQTKTNNVAYPCPVCKATFKSTKTRLHHMKTKHSVSTPAPNNALPGRQEVKQSTPIITPISICQPALLQVEPNGPLQKVDANIDTEQIRKLIESLGNVQKVNQVVILGQVPPNAPPLEVQQISELTDPLTLNLNPPQIDFMGLKQTESKGNELELSNNPMEQTIILEPITPDGQLENPSFSELGSRIAAGESIELTLVESEQTERPVAEVMNQILQQPEVGAVQSDAMDQVVCHNEVVEVKENMEQTVILELTSTLIPTVELEQSQNVSQTEMSSSSLVPTTELEKTPDQAVISEQETSLSVQSLMSTVELELTPLQTEQRDPPACPFVPPDTLTQTPNESETNAKDESDSQMQHECVDQVQSIRDGAEERQGRTQQAPPEIILIDHGEIQEQVEILPKVDSPSAKEDVTSQIEVKEMQLTSEVPINIMSAQELVKVRKRKPAKAFIFQGYMQELVGSVQNDVRPTKRQRTKKSHLVVKFGPQSKEKKNKKQKKHQSTQEAVLRVKTPTVNMSEKKVTSPNKGRKGKREKVEHAASTAETKSPPTKDRQHQQVKEDTRKNKMKQKDGAREGAAHISKATTPVFKKKQQKIMQKGNAKSVKDGKMTSKGKKKGLKRQQKTNAKTDSSDIPGPHIIPDSLLLLKGHKQPQLKVHKLDPSKATGQTQEFSTNESQTSQSKDSPVRHRSKESAGNLANDDKKKGGRPKKNQKALSLLSSLQVFRQPAETVSTKPKSTRKRKASPKVETEGVITSKRALECKDCGERFSEVSSLQKHKTTVHIVESPGLTYTNGNVFEGVSTLDLYQLPKESDKVVGVMNAGTGWDTEPEMGETDRERSVSFPALNLSPSSPVHPSDLFLSGYEDKGGNQTGTDGLSHGLPKVLSPSEPPLTISTKTQNPEVPESLVTDKDKNPSTDSEVQATADEDIKEDLLLEIDLVTVGGQNERDDQSSCQDSISQNESNLLDGNTDLSPGEAEKELTEKNLTLQTVSCSTNQVEVKEEEEEMLVQKQKDEGKGVVTKSPGRGRRRGAGRLKKGWISKRVLVEDTPRGTDPEREQDNCEVVYEKPSVPSNSEMNRDETHTAFSQSTSQTSQSHKDAAPVSSLPSVPSLTQKTPAEQVDVESGSTGAAEVSERGLQEHEREVDQSPGIILEKFVTSGQRATADNHRQGLNNSAGNDVFYEEIKVEENISDVPTCPNRQSLSVQPHHRDVRTILVKEESSLVLNDTQTISGSRHIRWNVEVNTESSSSPLMESRGETTDCSVAPDFNTNQCIFYPVKEEEREVLLGAAQANTGCGSSGDSSSTHHTEHQTPDSNLHKGSYTAQEYQETRVRGMSSEPGVGDFSDGQAELDNEWQQTSDVRDFLLQSSDEEDVCAPELCDPQLDSEAEIMAYFYKNQNSCQQQPHETTQSVAPSTNQLQPPVENSSREPIEYFSKYFSWDCWVDISHCTNKLSTMSSPVSAKEVAQFVGIHIAMGTLKFPSPRLYWEDLTKVPLIANAMPLSRFLELSRMLKLASPVMEPVNSNNTEESNCDFHNKLQATSLCSTAGICNERRLPEVSQRSNENLKTLQTDPLWKVQPLLCRFLAGCHSLKQESDYAVDQYPLPLTGKMHSSKPSLHCTTLIGFGGLLSHVDLKLDLSDKEDTVEKMAPKGSMVFLCKQELSTPVMLERLLVAGVHGAGRVGGARGQIGDEFVSSDGKLMLRRSHCGFILSTAGNYQRNMVSLSDSFEKAQMSARLNRDLQNLYSIPFTASTPTSWPQAVLWYLTDLALVNSWLQYKQDHRAAATTLTLLAFRLEVSKALILSSGSDTQDSVPPQPPTENAHTTNVTPNPSLLEESPLPDASTRYDGSGHWPEQLGEGEGGRCRFGDCQRTSRVLCLKCCVFLCISRNHNCFLNFHSQGSLGKES
ncbi:zinc finger protein 576, tandem duplicate 1 isoform X2 [Sphaeramia orbicularis]|uniref:zinc finger protein 576, tandem duplicate 1 isoform X2 n=1 Tax=Sphaeramia orbicularis TaxID=375764 RepID=UPI0011810919|nr:uncharacterized protein LOC115435529 isoform X2 [Sphaeramia orbicularis]